VAVSICLVSSILALFLQTVFALTRETPVAEVIMSPIQSDDGGQYITIDYTPYIYPTALSDVLHPQQVDDSKYERGETTTYKIYGDTVAIRGPLIKLYPSLLILNYSNTYKLSVIEGEYRYPGSQHTQPASQYEINGGFDASWWNLNNQEANFPYNMIIDRFTFSGDEEPGFFQGEKKRYEVVMTMDAITWNFLGNVSN
jgi:hypothetical protein